jgi:hypothetical protein
MNLTWLELDEESTVLRAWSYWHANPPDSTRAKTIAWKQGDDIGPWDGEPMAGSVADLLALERDGWLTIGVWWRRIG